MLAERGQGLDATNEDQQVYVPLTTAMRRLLNIDYYGSILVEVGDAGRRWTGCPTDIEGLLRVRHRISAFRPDDFRVSSQKDLIETQLASAEPARFPGALDRALRPRRVGPRRARHRLDRGARPDHRDRHPSRARRDGARRVLPVRLRGDGARHHRRSALASALGWLASRITAHQAALPFVFEGGNALLALGMALVLNLIFASWPAIRAARLDPIRALKHE